MGDNEKAYEVLVMAIEVLTDEELRAGKAAHSIHFVVEQGFANERAAIDFINDMIPGTSQLDF